MANKFTRFLTGLGQGLIQGATNPKGGLASWRHASRLFIDNTYRLSPRTKFLFYVRFEINKEVLKSATFSNRHADEVGYLVKSADLPKVKLDAVTKNQYNRKKIFYKNYSYDPVSIKFHDDSAGVINALWALYIGTYVQDRHNPQTAFSRTQLMQSEDTRTKFRYGLDINGRTFDFFDSISIYSMSRRRFLGYTLINPKITNWTTGDMNYGSGSEFNEMSMSLDYETYYFSSGNVAVNSPKGFASLYYDNVPSPLTVAGGGVSTLTGEGGVLDGLESVFGDVSSGSAFGSPQGFLSTTIKAINTYKNFKGLSKDQLKQEAINIISSPATIRSAINNVGGIVGSVFPKNETSNNTTSALPKKLIGR